MKCPRCGGENLKVLDSRATDGNSVRRRRQFLDCKYSFTTYEYPFQVPEQNKKNINPVLNGFTYSKKDLQNRLMVLSLFCDITPLEISEILIAVSDLEKDAVYYIPSQNIDADVLKVLSKKPFSYFAAYAMSRFEIDSLDQLSKLWMLGDKISLDKISEILAGKSPHDDDTSQGRAIPLFPKRRNRN